MAQAIQIATAIQLPAQGNASGTTAIHFVEVGDSKGADWQQADGLTIAQDLARGEYGGTYCRPLRVIVADPVAGTCADISEAVAEAVAAYAIDRDMPVDSATYAFLETHLGIVAAREVRRIGDDEDENFNARRAA
jgi:hypothetical protein